MARHVAARMELWRFRQQRLLWIRDRLQHRVLDLHLVRGPACLLGMLGGDQRDCLAPIAHHVGRKHRLIRDLEAIGVLARHILEGEHRFDPWGCLRGLGVDRLDARVWMRASNCRTPQHPVHLEVRRIREVAADLLHGIGSPHSVADTTARSRFLSEARLHERDRPAARFTASMIFA